VLFQHWPEVDGFKERTVYLDLVSIVKFQLVVVMVGGNVMNGIT